jgi:1,2-diacylglycerol 3-alpha-glucosyltransferase
MSTDDVALDRRDQVSTDSQARRARWSEHGIAPVLAGSVPARLRIAFVTDTFENGDSGGTISAVRFVHALRKQHDVVVVATGGQPGPGRIVLPGFQVPVRAMRANGFTMAIPRRRLIEAAIAGVDVVHLQFPFFVSFATLACARRLGVPVVAAFHVQPENILRNVGIRSHRLSRAFYRLWVNRLYNRVDAVVCPTEFAESMLVRHGLTAPSFVISNGVSPAIRRRHHSREARYENTFLILMVGRLAPEKRHDVMFEALRRARHRDRLRLVIAGSGPLEQYLRRRAGKLPHRPEFLGFVSDPGRLERLYNTADILVHASEVEIEGMAVLEAMSCGLPVIVADSPDSASTRLALGAEFLFASGDAASLAARIDHYVEHPEELAAAGTRAYEAARAYSFESSIARLVTVYRHVVRSPMGAGAATT